MRRNLLPFGLVGILGFLVLGAALFGSAQSPNLYLPSLPRNDPHAASELDAYIERTMLASSFTWKVLGENSSESEKLVYNAPDRIHDYRGSTSPIETMAVGPTYYFQASDLLDSGNGWLRVTHPPRGYSDARIYAMTFLIQLRGAPSVVGEKGSFDVHFLFAGQSYASGDVATDVKVHTSDGYISALHIQDTGIFPAFGPRLASTTAVVKFVDIGSSPHVVIPAARTVRSADPSCGPATSGVTVCPA